MHGIGEVVMVVVTPLVFLLGGELLNSLVISSLSPLVYLLYLLASRGRKKALHANAF